MKKSWFWLSLVMAASALLAAPAPSGDNQAEKDVLAA
jgi:hypothetical protein